MGRRPTGHGRPAPGAHRQHLPPGHGLRHHGHGTYHKLNEFLPSFLKGCIQLGAFPDLRTKIEMVPVDFIARVLGDVLDDPTGLGKTYQMNHPAALPARDFVATIRAYGYPLRLLPWDV